MNGQSYTEMEFQQLFSEYEAGLIIAVQRTEGDQLLIDLQKSARFHTVPIQMGENCLHVSFIVSRDQVS
ncbi:hypothetical protein BsIDN1_63300 [Bacillus safensis]|uniref:Uncharacterized protein n=1 Tax=Bacillus safensis TaxID=561879 RepID=A0A5S9MJ88_BACIA|nr:hypothetical protein BsIDN1_63300 [Bacillus safensis]